MNTGIYWIESSSPKRLGIMPRPRGGSQLGEEVRALSVAGVHTLVSLLTEPETTELELVWEAQECQKRGIDFVNFPIKDRHVPSLDFQLVTFIEDLAGRLVQGSGVVIHCRMGVGRASLIAASVLVLCDVPPQEAFAAIRKARRCEVPDTVEQRVWVDKFARTYQDIKPLSDLWLIQE
jgi:protein-tyrosine phosphatase